MVIAEKGKGERKSMKLSSVVYHKNVLWTSIIIVLLVSVTMINVASASPDTHFWVNPPVVGHVTPGPKLIEIKITDAPKTFAWEISVSWDPNLLELLAVVEGDFLHRGGAYATDLAHVPLAEANPEGEIIISCALIGEVPMEEWASGDGLLVTLGFNVETEGDCFISLFDTRLADHLEEGYPAYTYYPNIDGFPETVGIAEAALKDWKLKVNEAAGIGKGHKSTVGKENLLEAYVENTGTFDVHVQAFFEIRDSFFHPIFGSPIESNIAQLAPGETIILSGTWTAANPDVFYITAYLFYTFYGAVTPSGFSRTLSLRVDMLP